MRALFCLTDNRALILQFNPKSSASLTVKITQSNFSRGSSIFVHFLPNGNYYDVANLVILLARF